MLAIDIINKRKMHNNLMRLSSHLANNVDISDINEAKQIIKNFCLNEKFGVFDYEDKHYFELFKNLIIDALDELTNKKEPNFNNFAYVYADKKDIFFKGYFNNLIYKNNKEFQKLNQLKIYINANASKLNVFSYIEHYDSKTEDMFNKDEFPLFDDTNNRYICSIIMELTENDLNNFTIEQLAGMLLHELQHIMHTVLSKPIATYLGDANYISQKLMLSVYNKVIIPNLTHVQEIFNYLKNNNWRFNSQELLIQFIAICIYYCDMSERPAYLQNLRADIETYKNKIKTFKSKKEFIHFINLNSETFQIYFTLYRIFQEWKNEKINIKINNDIKNEIDEFINIELLNGEIAYNIKNRLKDIKKYNCANNINDMCTMWCKAVYKQCKYIDKIITDYYDNFRRI